MLVKVQATVRGMLARKQYLRLKQNCDPNSYVLVMPDNPDHWFRFEMLNRKEVERAASPEAQPVTIATILEQLGDFVYGDESSEKMLEDLDMQVMERKQVNLGAKADDAVY